jgi:primary-amine oxidase
MHLPQRIAVLLPFVVCAAIAQNAAPQNPLDALTAGEYWAVYDVLEASGNLTDKTHFASVSLREPPKERVLAWAPGKPFSREADVTLVRDGHSFSALIDISGRKLESWSEVQGAHAAAYAGEFNELEDTIKQDPKILEALKKRGITNLAFVQCTPLPAGYIGIPEQDGRRIFWGGCSTSRNAPRSDGHEIGGIFFVVDMGAKKVLRVSDFGPVPVPTASNEFPYDPDSPPRPGTTPLIVSQPMGPGFRITDGEVSWQGWHFRVRLDPRVGPLVHQVKFEDGGRLRSVLYEASLSELFVPYMDPEETWASGHVFLDAGEYSASVGGLIKPLRPDVDCPANAKYLSGTFVSSKGAPQIRPQLACLFERYTGDVAWRHQEQAGIAGRPSRDLVLRAVATIGNYDYIFDWRFQQDGSIHVAIGATGIIEAKAVAATAVNESHTSGSGPSEPHEEYGHLVADHISGVNHDHFFSYRLDLDVDGPNNSLMVDRLVPKRLPPSSPRKSIWAVEMAAAATEQQGILDIHLDHPAMWRIVNPNVRGPLGYPTGYEIMPEATGISLLAPDDWPQRRAGFSAHQLWVTPYRPNEFYAAGLFPSGSKGEDGLPVWTKANRPIENTDIVAWYTLGFHHVPRAEDWPIMPTMWHEFVIRPYDFFSKNPALDLPLTP